MEGLYCIDSIMNKAMFQKCEGWDLNPRTPTRQNLKSCTVGQALLPSQLTSLYSGNILKVLKFDD